MPMKHIHNQTRQLSDVSLNVLILRLTPDAESSGNRSELLRKSVSSLVHSYSKAIYCPIYGPYCDAKGRLEYHEEQTLYIRYIKIK